MRRKRRRDGQIGTYWVSTRPNRPGFFRTWFDPATRQTRRASLDAADADEAQLRLAEWVLANQRLKSEPPQEVFFEVLLARYLKRAENERMPSLPQAMIAARLWSDFFAGATVSEITYDRVDEFIEHLRAKGHSRGYISRTLSVGRAALNAGRKRGEITYAPFIRDVETQAQRYQKEPLGRPLEIEEVAALFNAIKSRHIFLFCLLMVNTVSRDNAILDLKKNQIDTRYKFIDLNPPGRQQTKKYRPSVPLTRTLEPFVDLFPETGYIVSYGRGGKRVDSVKTSFRALRRNAGLDDRVNPYSFRHTISRYLRSRDVPDLEIQVILGHKVPGVTSIYAPFKPGYLKHCKVAIDEFQDELRKRTDAYTRWLDVLRVHCVSNKKGGVG